MVDEPSAENTIRELTAMTLANAMSVPARAALYSFTILNKTGMSQSYTLFSQPPIVKPTVEKLTPHAILVTRGVASGSGNAFLTIPCDEHYAICGLSHEDESVQMRVLDRCAVTVGRGLSYNFRPGTTCVVDMLSAAPSFVRWGGPASDTGELGAFCLRTPGGFTYEQAKNNQWIVGLGLYTSGSAFVGIYASFTPTPRTDYQIEPSKVFYVVPRALEANEKKPEDLDFSQECKVNFELLSPRVQLVHDDDNIIRISEGVSSGSRL